MELGSSYIEVTDNLNNGLKFFDRYIERLTKLLTKFDENSGEAIDLENFYLAYWEISRFVDLTRNFIDNDFKKAGDNGSFIGILKQDSTTDPYENFRKKLRETEFWKKTITDIFKQSLIEVFNQPETYLSNLFEQISESVVSDLLTRNVSYKLVEKSNNPDHALIFNQVKSLLKELFNKAIYQILTQPHIENNPAERAVSLQGRIKAKIEEFKLRQSYKNFIDRQESRQIDNQCQLKTELELQEVSELYFTCLMAIPETNKSLEVFKQLEKSLLPGHSFIDSKDIDTTKIFTFFKHFVDSADKQYSKSEHTAHSRPTFNNLEKSIFIKLIVLYYINRAKQEGKNQVDLNQAITIVERFLDSQNAENLVWQNYLLCINQAGNNGLETQNNYSKREVEVLQISEADYEIKQVFNNLALVHLYLPGGKSSSGEKNIGRFTINYIEDSDENPNYLPFLVQSGLQGFIDARIKDVLKNRFDIDTVKVKLIFYDGSLQVSSKDPKNVGVTKKDFPTIGYTLALNNNIQIAVEADITLIDHHPEEGDKKLEHDASCKQVLNDQSELQIPTEPGFYKLIVAAAEEPRGLDTDVGMSHTNIDLYYADNEWFERHRKEVKILTELINIIDIYDGSPLLNIPEGFGSEYTNITLLFPLLFLPEVADLTVNRAKVNGQKLKDILTRDNTIFKLFVEFIKKNFANINSYEDLIVSFCGRQSSNLGINLFRYRIYLRANDIEEAKITEIIDAFKDSSVEISSKPQTTVFEIKVGSYNIKLGVLTTPEQRDTKVVFRLNDIGIFLLGKNVDDPNKQNLSCGLLIPEKTSENAEYIKYLKLTKKHFTEFMDHFYSVYKKYVESKQHFAGGLINCGTRDAGTGICNYLDNLAIVEIFVNQLNNILTSGISLDKVTLKALCVGVFDEATNFVKFEKVLQNNNLVMVN